MTTPPDEDEPDDQEREPSPDDLLEAARHDQQFVSRPEAVGPAIGSDRIIRTDAPETIPVREVYRLPNGKLVAKAYDDAELLTPEEWEAVGVEYAEAVAQGLHARRHDKWLEWGPDEWRQIPEFPSYQMHGYTREVRKLRTLKDGTVKIGPVTARKSSVTLSEDGVTSGHGIEKLWRLTFPEYVPDENSWQVHALRHEAIPEGFGRVVKTGW